MKLIVTLQVAGFVAAIILLFTHAPHWAFVAAFGVHVLGDLLFVAKEGI